MGKLDTSHNARQKILVVDDHTDILDMVELVLEDEWQVLCACDSDQAVELARRERPTAILLDARMPKGDGFTTFARLRDDPATRSTPVILMSALASATEVPPGFAGIISKPFDPLELAQRIRRILAS